MIPETRVFQAADDEDLMILACTVLDWSTRVMDRRTDRWTDGQTVAVAAFERKNLYASSTKVH